MPATAERVDPYLSFRFKVEIDGLIVGGFSDVSGLEIQVETEDYQEGGNNEYIHKLPKTSKYPNLILKRGLSDSEVLWKWQLEVRQGQVNRKNVRILLLDSIGQESLSWRCVEAYPVKWTGPEFKGDGSSIAIESLELVHRGIKE